jgi:hypothetical protein
MPLINNIEVVDRNNRPPADSRVLLKTYFVNDGVYTDPYAVSTVHVFKRSQNLSPNSVLDNDGLVASGMTSAAAMVFGVTGTGVIRTEPNSTDINQYTGVVAPVGAGGGHPCSGVSGLYKIDRGEFGCVLDGLAGSSLSGTDQNGNTIMNTASQAIRYFDIWTVKMFEGSSWKTYINNFELFDNTVFTTTEPIILRSSNKLFNRNVIAGSITNLKIGTEITVENLNISESIKNIFKQTAITSPSITIVKHNEDSSLPSKCLVTTSTDIDLTSDDTLIFRFDTDTLLSSKNPFAGFSIDDLGARTGTYSAQVTYNLLTEKIVSPLMYFIVK